MTREKFLDALRRQHAQPFPMRSGIGEPINTRRPLSVPVSPGRRRAVAITQGGSEESSTRFVDVMLVQEIEFLKDNAPASN